MEMKYSKEFVALAKNGNYMATAEDLFMAQSTLSKHIQCLEREFGHKLFYRNTRKVELTPFGKAYLPYAQEIVRIEEKCESELLNHWGAASTQIHLGLNYSLRAYDIPKAIQEFRQSNGGYDIDILTAETETLIDMLAMQVCDFAIVRDPRSILKSEKRDHFNLIPFYKDPMVLVVPSNHWLAERDYVTVDLLREETFLTLPETTAMYQNCLQECKKHSFEPHIKIISSSSAIFDTICSGYGVAIFGKKLMSSVASMDFKVLDIVPTTYLGIYIIHSSNHTMSYSAKLLMDYLCLKGDF